MKMKKKSFLGILLSLVMVLGLMPGMSLTARADELSEELATNTEQDRYTGDHFTIVVGDKGNGNGFHIKAYGASTTISALNGETITKLEVTKGSGDLYSLQCYGSKRTISDDGNVVTFANVNKSSAKLEGGSSGEAYVKAVKIYYTGGNPDPPTVAVSPDGAGTANVEKDGVNWKLTATPASGQYTFVKYTYTETSDGQANSKYSTDNPLSLARSRIGSGEISNIKAVFTDGNKADLKDATVEVNPENGAVTVTYKGNVVPDSEYDVFYTQDESAETGENSLPNNYAVCFAIVKAKDTSAEFEGKKVSDSFEWRTFKMNIGDTREVSVPQSINGYGSISHSWSSDNEDVAVVDGNAYRAVVTAKSLGTTTIKANYKAFQMTPAGYEFPKDFSESWKIIVESSSAEKAAVVIKAPTAKSLTYNGSPQGLITAGTTEGGTMNYAIGKDAKAVPTSGWSTSIPTATAVGTYYVWYKVVGDENHNDTEPKSVTAVIRGTISAAVTFKVVNGSWNDETTADKTVTLTGPEGETLKLTAAQIPAVGGKPADTYKEGAWDVTPSTEAAITAATTYTYTYAQKDSVSQMVTFKVVNGTWNDGNSADITVTLTGLEGETLKLTADQIPAVGSKPADTYKEGEWDVVPSTETAITAATTYTYTYVQKDSISQTVTFKVVNGKWDDETTVDKTVTLNGHDGDALKLAADQIPAVGTKPGDAYKAGSWDVTPNTETAITAAITYTYTYATKEAADVTKAPEAKALTYNGSAQALVTAGEASGGEIQYTLGTATEATQPYTTSIPTETNAGTYYVWYKVKGDETHNDTSPVCIPVTISESVAETVTVTFEAGGGTGSMTPSRMEKGSKFTFPAPEFFPPADRAFAHWKIGEKQYGIVSVKSLKLCVSTYTRLCTYIAVFLFLYNAKAKPYIGRNQSS